MYKYKPERNPRQALLLMILLSLFSCAVFFASSIINDSYRLLAQLVAILFFTFSIVTVVRYTLTEIEYSISEEAFGVSKKVGNKVIFLCAIDLTTVVALMDKKTYEHSKEFSGITVKFNHCQNIKAQSFVLLYTVNGKKSMIEFEPNVVFVKIMNEAIDNSKKNNEKDKNIPDKSV